jgi:hypothetical protein
MFSLFDNHFPGGVMAPSQHSRTTAKLPELMNRHLNMYALAASVAGVGLLAVTQPAEAKIVYTSADVQISDFGVFPYALDLNNDGIADFTFPTYDFENSGFFVSRMYVAPAVKGNRVWGVRYAAALKAGVRVGVEGKFNLTGTLLMGSSSGTSAHINRRGPWDNGGKGVKNRYLGLKFIIKDKIHFGWARINFTNPANVILTGYAYETIANKAIVTGETKGPDEDSPEESRVTPMPISKPATLGALALGAPGLSIWRREKVADARSQAN